MVFLSLSENHPILNGLVQRGPINGGAGLEQNFCDATGKWRDELAVSELLGGDAVVGGGDIVFGFGLLQFLLANGFGGGDELTRGIINRFVLLHDSLAARYLERLQFVIQLQNGVALFDGSTFLKKLFTDDAGVREAERHIHERFGDAADGYGLGGARDGRKMNCRRQNKNRNELEHDFKLIGAGAAQSGGAYSVQHRRSLALQLIARDVEVVIFQD